MYKTGKIHFLKSVLIILNLKRKISFFFEHGNLMKNNSNIITEPAITINQKSTKAITTSCSTV